MGTGLSGTVFEAFRRDPVTDFNHKVALKVFHSTSEDKGSERWISEFQSLQKVRSEFCVPVLGWERFGEGPALVLEFVDGLSLHQLVSSGSAQAEDLNTIGLQVFLGLVDLSRVDLFHGDLSPNNVLISKQGRVQLVDFGKANVFQGQRLFTPEFASERIIQGEAPHLQTDLESLLRVLEWACRETQLAQQLAVIEHVKTVLQNPSALDEIEKIIRAQNLSTLQDQLTQSLSCISGKQNDNFQTAAASAFDAPRSRWKTIAALFVIGVCLVGSLKTHTDVRPARLSIRTTQWVKVWWDNQAKGFTPVNMRNIEPGVHDLRWQTEDGREGFVVLTLKSNQHMVLGDAFFQKGQLDDASAGLSSRYTTGSN